MLGKRLRSLLTPWTLRAASRPHRPTLRLASCRPTVESLEARCLLSVHLLNHFTGISFSEDDAIAPGGGRTPPDTTGAAGPVEFVQTVNQVIRISNKFSGTPLVTDSLDDFWYTQGGLTPIAIHDSMMVWDDQVQRFIVGDQDVDTPCSRQRVSTSPSPSRRRRPR